MAAGAVLPDSIVYDGFNMLPVLQGNKDLSRTEMYWEFRGDHAARVGDWKWVHSKKGDELFNLSQDISEKNDVSGEHPDVAKKLQAAFEKWQKEMAGSPPRMPFKDY